MSDVIVSKTSPVAKKEGFKVMAEPLHLDEIPGAMDKMGWKIAAQLLRHWFSIKPAYPMPLNVRHGEVDPLLLPKSVINDNIVTMEWTKSYLQKSESMMGAYIELITSFHSPLGVDTLRKRLIRAGWKRGSKQKINLGYKGMSAVEMESVCQMNTRSFGKLLDTMDELYGALGTASFKAGVVGYTDIENGQDVFVVEELGIYVRDTYDFNDGDGFTPPLGIWSRDRVLSKAESMDYLSNPISYTARKFQGFVKVENSDFRRWQAAQKSGGDFLVYSDVEWKGGRSTIRL